MSKSSIIKNSTIIVILTILSKMTGFLRDILIASSFGTTYQTDAYNMALIIPAVLMSIVCTAITTGFLPILSKMLRENGKEGMFKFVNNVLNIVLIFTSIVYLILIIFTPAVINVIAPNFNYRTYELTIILTRICLLNLMIMVIKSIFSTILQTFEDFIAPTAIGIVLNLPIIIYIGIAKETGILELTIITVLGYILQVIVQIPWLIKYGYKYKLYFNFKDKLLKRLLILILPIVLGVGVNEINSFIDNLLASGLQEGSISAINYSTKINQIIYGIFAVAVVTAVYPVLARVSEDIKKFKYYITKCINNIVLIILPTSLLILILSKEVIEVLYKRGSFDENSVSMTAISLFYLSIGISFYGIRDIINRAFYSIQNTVVPMKNSIWGVVINISLDLLLVNDMGIGGLSLATSVSAIGTAIFLYRDLQKEIGSIMNKKDKSNLIKTIISALIMTIITYILKKSIFDFNRGYLEIQLIAIFIIAFVIYVISLKILKVDMLKENYKVIKFKIVNLVSR